MSEQERKSQAYADISSPVQMNGTDKLFAKSFNHMAGLSVCGATIASINFVI
jgi:hypothetical protein